MPCIYNGTTSTCVVRISFLVELVVPGSCRFTTGNTRYAPETVGVPIRRRRITVGVSIRRRTTYAVGVWTSRRRTLCGPHKTASVRFRQRFIRRRQCRRRIRDISVDVAASCASERHPTRQSTYPGQTSRSVTHPQIASAQARLTFEFIPN